MKDDKLILKLTSVKDIDFKAAAKDQDVKIAYMGFQSIRVLMSDEAWGRYPALGLKSTKEYKLLEAAAKKLKKALKKHATAKETKRKTRSKDSGRNC